MIIHYFKKSCEYAEERGCKGEGKGCRVLQCYGLGSENEHVLKHENTLSLNHAFIITATSQVG